MVIPATDKEAVHGVSEPLIRQGGEGAGLTSGGREYFHTSVHSIISIIATGQEDGCMGRRYDNIILLGHSHPYLLLQEQGWWAGAGRNTQEALSSIRYRLRCHHRS